MAATNSKAAVMNVLIQVSSDGQGKALTPARAGDTSSAGELREEAREAVAQCLVWSSQVLPGRFPKCFLVKF
jgi:hypothetical protein